MLNRLLACARKTQLFAKLSPSRECVMKTDAMAKGLHKADTNTLLWHADRECMQATNTLISPKVRSKVSFLVDMRRSSKLLAVVPKTSKSLTVATKPWFQGNDGWRPCLQGGNTCAPGAWKCAIAGFMLPKWLILAAKALLIGVIIYIVAVAGFTTVIIVILEMLDRMKR